MLELGFVILFAILIGAFTALGRRRGGGRAVLCGVEVLESLPDAVGQAVETGRRLHISLGSGTIGEMDTAAALAGLTVLDQISAVAAVSDKPPVVTTADGTAMFLAQDTLRNVYERQNASQRYDPSSARVAGLSPMSFGAAVTTMIKDESVAGTVLVGSVGPEAVLIAEAGSRVNINTVAGSSDPSEQELLFAAADNPLVGEDLFVGGAYIGRHPAHIASLQAQDVMRILIGFAILGGVLAKTFGL